MIIGTNYNVTDVAMWDLGLITIDDTMVGNK